MKTHRKRGGDNMTRQILLCCAGALGILSAGCADSRESSEQRPVYSHENVEVGQADSGYEYRTEEIEKKELPPSPPEPPPA
jgi:hypothetical protein